MIDKQALDALREDIKTPHGRDFYSTQYSNVYLFDTLSDASLAELMLYGPFGVLESDDLADIPEDSSEDLADICWQIRTRMTTGFCLGDHEVARKHSQRIACLLATLCAGDDRALYDKHIELVRTCWEVCKLGVFVHECRDGKIFAYRRVAL